MIKKMDRQDVSEENSHLMQKKY